VPLDGEGHSYGLPEAAAEHNEVPSTRSSWRNGWMRSRQPTTVHEFAASGGEREGGESGERRLGSIVSGWFMGRDETNG
jgi:hypothetical protein